MIQGKSSKWQEVLATLSLFNLWSTQNKPHHKDHSMHRAKIPAIIKLSIQLEKHYEDTIKQQSETALSACQLKILNHFEFI